MAGGSGKLLKDGPALEEECGNPAGASEVMLLMRDCPLVAPRLAEPVRGLRRPEPMKRLGCPNTSIVDRSANTPLPR
jgi:hypothetical protein